MRGRPMTDREAYPAAWITLAVLAGAFLLWRFVLGEPTVSRCWLWEHWHVYCPGCGGTRAIMSLLRGDVLTSFVLHPLVPYAAAVGGWFMLTQTIQRISKGRLSVGMKYRDVYLWIALGLVAANFLVKNILLINGVDLIAWALK